MITTKLDQSKNNLKIVNIPHYQTTDGRTFTSEHEASRHQNLLTKAEELTEEHMFQVYGTTARGWGTEIVRASHQSLFNYTVKVLNKLKEDGKYFP